MDTTPPPHSDTPQAPGSPPPESVGSITGEKPRLKADSKARLDRLSRYSANKNYTPSATYSLLIRRLRLILPIVAMIIFAALLAWPALDDDIAILKQEQTESLQTIRKNELTNARFESVDQKNQPYALIAKLAVQDDNNEDLMHLEEPEGEISLNSGENIRITAEVGRYKQEASLLYLENNVRLTHSHGYEIIMSALDMDIKAGTAQSHSEINGEGPDATLYAQNGLQADNKAGLLILNGPAKLVLYESGSLQGLSHTQTYNNSDDPINNKGSDREESE